MRRRACDRLLLNLIDNALRYAQVRVSVTARAEAAGCC